MKRSFEMLLLTFRIAVFGCGAVRAAGPDDGETRLPELPATPFPPGTSDPETPVAGIPSQTIALAPKSWTG